MKAFIQLPLTEDEARLLYSVFGNHILGDNPDVQSIYGRLADRFEARKLGEAPTLPAEWDEDEIHRDHIYGKRQVLVVRQFPVAPNKEDEADAH